MKNNDYWKRFIKTGKINDYLHYIACTEENLKDDFEEGNHFQTEKEGGSVAGFNYRDGNGPVSHAGW